MTQAVQEGHAFGEMFLREVEVSLIAFCLADCPKSLSSVERRSEFVRQTERLLVQLTRCSPLALPVERDRQIAEAGAEPPAVTLGSCAVRRFAR
jgi:hypothetical protein